VRFRGIRRERVELGGLVFGGLRFRVQDSAPTASTNTAMIAESGSKRRSMFIDSSGIHRSSTVLTLTCVGQLRPTQISDAAGTTASG
jgi:hypothetical protein